MLYGFFTFPICLLLKQPFFFPKRRQYLSSTNENLRMKYFTCHKSALMENGLYVFTRTSNSLLNFSCIYTLTAMQCPAVTPPDNGILTLPCVEQYKSVCLVKCKQGFDLKGTNLIDCNVNNQQATYWNKPTQCQGLFMFFFMLYLTCTIDKIVLAIADFIRLACYSLFLNRDPGDASGKKENNYFRSFP